MSGVSVIQHVLTTDATLLEVVPADRVFPGNIPLQTAVPALGVSEVSAIERTTVSTAEPTKLQTERVQITIHAGSYLAQKEVLALVRKACRNRHGLVNLVDLLSILPAGEGPDGFEPAGAIYQQTIDFSVRWRSS